MTIRTTFAMVLTAGFKRQIIPYSYSIAQIFVPEFFDHAALSKGLLALLLATVLPSKGIVLDSLKILKTKMSYSFKEV